MQSSLNASEMTSSKVCTMCLNILSFVLCAGIPPVLQLARTNFNHCDWGLPCERDLSHLSSPWSGESCHFSVHLCWPSARHSGQSSLPGECRTNSDAWHDWTGKLFIIQKKRTPLRHDDCFQRRYAKYNVRQTQSSGMQSKKTEFLKILLSFICSGSFRWNSCPVNCLNGECLGRVAERHVTLIKPTILKLRNLQRDRYCPKFQSHTTPTRRRTKSPLKVPRSYYNYNLIALSM